MVGMAMWSVRVNWKDRNVICAMEGNITLNDIKQDQT